MSVIPTGIPPIDEALVIGGIPFGAITELIGTASSGKSYLTLRIIAEAQRQGRVCALLDTECSFDAHWANLQGVDTTALLVLRPASTEQAETMMEEIFMSQCCDLLVIDSLDALCGRTAGAEQTILSAEQSPMRFLYAIIPHIHNVMMLTGMACVITSQWRERLDNQHASLANDLMRCHADIRVLLSPSATNEHGADILFDVKRHNLSQQLRQANFHIEFL